MHVNSWEGVWYVVTSPVLVGRINEGISKCGVTSAENPSEGVPASGRALGSRTCSSPKRSRTGAATVQSL